MDQTNSHQGMIFRQTTDFSEPPAALIDALFCAPTGDRGSTAESLNEQRMIRLQFRYNFY